MAGSQKMMRGRIAAQVSADLGARLCPFISLLKTLITGVYYFRTSVWSGCSNKAESLGEAISTGGGGCPSRGEIVISKIFEQFYYRSYLILFSEIQVDNIVERRTSVMSTKLGLLTCSG